MQDTSTEIKTHSVGLTRLPKMTARPHINRYEEVNRVFAKNNAAFIAACSKAGTEPTTRQASKFRNKRGVAYKNKM